jgi:hypothetical protein
MNCMHQSRLKPISSISLFFPALTTDFGPLG